MSATATDARRVVVLGGTSDIALAIVAELVRRGPRQIVLVGRDGARLADAAQTLRDGGATEIATVECDAEDTDRHEAAMASAFERYGGADLVLLAVGRLGARGGIPDDAQDAVDVLRVNVVGAGSLAIHAARRLRRQGSGTLVVLSSVAGERVRRSNLVYGAAKAGLDALARGLGDALHADGVRVMVVRPGFVHTRMTRGLDPAPLATSADAVAQAVMRGLERGDPVVWAPPTLRWLMMVIRMLPTRLFRRLPL